MKRSVIFTVLAITVALVTIRSTPVYADVNNFTITHFSSDQTLSRNDPQGSLHIIETIDVTFTDNNHGIIRAIPDDYNGQPLNFHLNTVSSRSGAAVQVDQSYQNGNVLLRIGDPNRTVTGAQQYTIDYDVQNVISFYGDHDELYWDVNGDQWAQPTTIVDVKLHLPSGITLSGNEPQCFAGVYGETNQTCTITHTQNEVDASASNLQPNQTLTYVAGFTKGYFQTASVSDKVKDNLNPLLSLIGLPVAIAAGSFTWWWRRGRDAKGRGVIIPEYEPPKGLSPIEAGTLIDFKTENRDITATIIDLARRGYIRIHETVTDRKILKDKLSYELELLNADTSVLNTYEKELITGLFSQLKVGDKLALGTVNTAMYTVAQKLRKSVTKDLKANGYLQKIPVKNGLLLVGAVVVAVTLLAIVFGRRNPNAGGPIVLGAIVSLGIIGIFWGFMKARTTQGVAAKEHLLGLKLYMETVDKDRLEKLQAPNAEYASNHNEPVRTVELFEKLLPFAMIMGVEKQWAKQFESLYTSAPDWYNGNFSTFNAVYLTQSLDSSFGQAINTSFTPPQSSGSSGFGGGGFSGGGGGGGGGGGW